MKRPLCFVSLIITAIVFVYLEIYLSELICPLPDETDAMSTEIVGVVAEKEIKNGYSGGEQVVIYLIPNKKLNGNFRYLECYLETGGYIPSVGETVLIKGKIKTFSAPTNPGEFDSRLYYSTLKIAYRIQNSRILKIGGKPNKYKESLFNVKRYLEKTLDRTMTSEDAAVMKAILLGDKSYMDDEIKELYKSNGIMHIMAVSGIHISFLGMGLYKLLRKLKCNNLVSLIVPITVMSSYGAMCGMGTSAFRAICMFAFKIFAPIIGRTYDILTSLALVEILLLIDQPLYLYSSGFLFSFGAVLGITVVRPLIKPYGFMKKQMEMKFADDEVKKREVVFQKLGDGLASSFSIFLVTLPVYASFYYTYPLHSIFINLLVIPLVGLLMAMGVLSVFVGMISSVIASAPAALVHMILLFYKVLCSQTGIKSRLTWYMGHSNKWQVAIYIALLMAFIAVSWKFKDKKLLRLDVLRGGLIIAAIFILTYHSHNFLEIDMVDVGQGDGIVISCNGKNLLVDGGSTSKKNVGKYQLIPFLKYMGIGRLDAVVLTHEDEDHLSGILEIMDDMETGGIRIKELIMPGIADASKGDNYCKLENRALELNIPIHYICSGEKLKLGKAEFTCLNPTKNMIVSGANEYSTVFYMKYGQFRALFTGDVEGQGQESLKRIIRENPGEYSDITLLKVAHHGSMYTTDQEFLDMTSPKIALISCGENNSYGHPHSELLNRLDDAEAYVYRTDLNGEISVIVKNDSVRVRPMKQSTSLY